MSVNFVCSVCKSEDIRRDAYAEWCTSSQQWLVASVFDEYYCQNCDGDTSIEEIEHVDKP